MNREPLFGCDGGCEWTHHEEDLRVFEGKVLCDYCWEGRIWPEAPSFEHAFSDLPPFKSPHLVKNHPDGQWQPIETAPKDADSIILRNRNTGERNTGNWNTGHFNTGNGNSGNNNSGYGNTGDFNSGAWNTGNFNTGSWDEFRLFDKKADRKEWEDADKPRFIFRVDPTEADGNMKAAWKIAFDGASEEDIQLLLRLPRFSKKVFKAITGIDLKGVKKK